MISPMHALRLATLGLLLSVGAGAAVAAERSFPVAAAPALDDVYPERVTAFPDGVRGLADITYSVVPGFRPLVLDLYQPASAGPHPLVIYIHGGGWVGGHTRHSGALTNFPAVLAKLAAEGFVVASLEYRLAAEAPFPAQLQDVRAALRFLRAGAAKYRIDGGRVAVWGGSAGGHLAALLATTCGDASFDPSPAPARSDCVQGVAAWYPVLDVERQAERGDGALSRLLDCRGPCDVARLRRASPVAFVKRDTPPFLLIHGEGDKTVDVSQSRIGEAKLKAAGVPVEAIYLPGVDHSFIGATPEQTRAATSRATNATFDWFHRVLDARKP